MAEAFRFYRDELNWQVYPVDGPWSDKPDPGKKPSVKAWWNYDPKECDVAEFFNPQRCHNIGVCPTGKLYIVDLDSKTDQGKSVYEFIASKPTLAKILRHRTRGGCHLVFYCEDVPPIRKPRSNKPYDKALFSQISETVGAEFYHNDHQNVVFPPSIHTSMFQYVWEVMGAITTVSWEWLTGIFGFSLPGAKAEQPKKETPFHLFFDGDFKYLDLVKVAEKLNLVPELNDAESGKYTVTCPWSSEHTGGDAESSTVIWQLIGEGWPRFKCLHSHCETRGLKDFTKWAESREKGIIDSHCSQMRVWQEGQKDAEGKPRILHVKFNELDSVSHTNLGKIMGEKQEWFDWLGKVCLLDNIKSGNIYVDKNIVKADPQKATVMGFKELSGAKANGHCEYFCTPGYLDRDELGNTIFITASFGMGYFTTALEDPHLLAELPNPHRILTVAIPFVDPKGKKLIYPGPGYDPHFHTYLIHGAPQIDHSMSVSKAKEILAKIHEEFCFENDQSRVHAYARIITPFARGILDDGRFDFTTRVPLWVFRANRPRAGKDYCAVMTILLYEGIAAEDSPINHRQSEETGKRIMSAARNGRRFMHFSNCSGMLDDIHLTQAITNERITARQLGSNEATSDLSVPNTMEFSISGNTELVYTEDLDERSRQIFLAFDQEDANARRFKNPFLHRSVRERRAENLSAIATLYREWERAGMPLGKGIFTTYPDWAEIVGGVMAVNDLGNPTLPFKSDRANVSGDRRTEAMAALYEVCHHVHGENWIKKADLIATVHEAQQDTDQHSGVEALEFFGSLKDSERSLDNRKKFGAALNAYNRRILRGIRMLVDIQANSGRNTYRFIKEGPRNPENPENVSNPVKDVEDVSLHNSTREKNSAARGNESKEDNRGKTTENDLQKTDIFDISDKCDRDARLAVDIETYSDEPKSKGALDAFKGKVRLVSIANSEGIQTFDLKQAPLPREIAAALMERELIIHNAAFELRFLGVKFEIFPENVFCTLTADWLLSPRKEQIHDLKSALSRHHGIEIPKGQATSDWGSFVLTGEQIEYAKNDVRYLHRHRDVLEKKLIEAGLADIFEMESRLLPIIARMEAHGFPVNPDLMRGLKATADINAGNLAVVLRKDFANEALNPGSNPQLLEAFKRDGIELKDTKDETLSVLEDPRAQTIVRWRAEAKLSSNIETLLKAGHQARIYSRFNPLGTVTGRFSSKLPNLQNITRGPLRSAFIPSGPDRRLIVADYSQIELRVAALVAKESVMISAFKTKADLHKMTAAAVLQKPIEEVTTADRQMAKAVSFGFLYGQSAKGFVTYARTTYGLNLSLEDAERFRENFFSTHYGFRLWHIECRRKSVSPGNDSARTVFGRLLVAKKDDAWARFNLHTEYVVSGSCADLIKVAMIKISSVMPSDVHLVATVHDELIYDVPVDIAEQYRGVIRQTMIEAFVEMFGTEVPVEVEAKVCANWGEK